MEPNTKLRPGQIIQLNPEICKNKMLAGCFMTITELKSFGAQGYIQCTGENMEMGPQAYYRAMWEEMELCGEAVWVVSESDEIIEVEAKEEDEKILK